MSWRIERRFVGTNGINRRWETLLSWDSDLPGALTTPGDTLKGLFPHCWGWNPRPYTWWASSLPLSHSQVWRLQNQHIHFLYGKWDQRFCLTQLLLWFLLFGLFVFVCLYFAWPVSSHSALADWSIIFQLTGYLCWRNSLSQPWAQCSLLISRQCLWLKIMSAAFEEYYSWYRKRSFGSSFIVCIMHYNQIFKN